MITKPNLVKLSVNSSLLKTLNLKSSSAKREPSKNIKFNFKISKKVENDILEQKYKSRHHPGIMNLPCIHLPSTLLGAVLKAKEEFGFPTSSLEEESRKLSKYIWSRKLPIEEEDLKKRLNLATLKLVRDENRTSIDVLSPSEKKQLQISLRQQVCHWNPIKFTDYMSFVYLWARLAPDYATLLRIFSEIKRRQEDFTPLSLFDFGSGVGSVMWAANSTWPDYPKEIYNVDSNSSMLALSERLFNSRETKNCPNIYYRQFLPVTDNLKYDLVVSSRSLFELGNLKARARTADILWRKVSDGGFLVFVEAGTKVGYSILMEIRDYILEINRLENEKYSVNTPLHVFSPCPHDQFCPRFNHKSGVPCHFQVLYQNFVSEAPTYDSFSYIVFQKGNRKVEEWPRIVQPVLKRGRHVITRTCTPSGLIREFTATKSKHGASCYHVCKRSRWGDLLPIEIFHDTLDHDDSFTES